jgi:hypothetical protein
MIVISFLWDRSHSAAASAERESQPIFEQGD